MLTNDNIIKLSNAKFLKSKLPTHLILLAIANNDNALDDLKEKDFAILELYILQKTIHIMYW